MLITKKNLNILLLISMIFIISPENCTVKNKFMLQKTSELKSTIDKINKNFNGNTLYYFQQIMLTFISYLYNKNEEQEKTIKLFKQYVLYPDLFDQYTTALYKHDSQLAKHFNDEATDRFLQGVNNSLLSFFYFTDASPHALFYHIQHLITGRENFNDVSYRQMLLQNLKNLIKHFIANIENLKKNNQLPSNKDTWFNKEFVPFKETFLRFMKIENQIRADEKLKLQNRSKLEYLENFFQMILRIFATINKQLLQNH